MKLISLFFSVLLHFLFVVVLIYLLSPRKIVKSYPKVYTVELIKLQSKPKPRPQPGSGPQKIVLKKAVKIGFKKPEAKKIKKLNIKKKNIVKQKKNVIKVIKKPEKVKKKTVKIKVKKKIYRRQIKKIENKPNIQKKIRLLKEKIMVEQLRQKLLEEKIRMLKEKIYSQEEAQRMFKQKLANNYLSIIEGVIYNNWGVEKTVIKNKIFITKVDIKLDSKGNLINISIMRSSGNAYFDGTCVDAIKQSAPFPPPPKEILTGGVVEFIITFDSREQK